MRTIMLGILMILLSVASATAGTCHYRDYLGSTRAVVDTAGVLLQGKKTQYFQYMEQEIFSNRCIEWRYTHDRGDRITKTEYRIDNGEWKEQSAQSYDRIGRLTAKTIGLGGNNTSRLISYGYDLQGRVNTITSPWYNQRLYYTSNPFDSGAPISYNGNLSASHDTMWEDANGTAVPGDLKFTHRYDALNRLTSSIDTHSDGDYGETMEYDANGNIMHITRDYDGSRVQDLAIVRDGNRIVSMYDVSDDDRIGEVPQIPSGDYVSAVSYDANGNITRDDSRNVTSITYHDYLDLPKSIKIGSRENRFYYRPDGRKSRQRTIHTVMSTVSVTDSLGNTSIEQKPTTKIVDKEYVGDFIKTGNYTWEVPTEDGHIFIDTRNKIKTHYYYVRDYLGSTRAVVDTAGVLLQTMNYYPSGVPFSRMELQAVTDRLHTGKPFLDMNGLGYYDNNARFYDALTGSFISRDALAGSYPHLSPYAHCANNPLTIIDPTGNDIVVLNYGNDIKHQHLAMLIQNEEHKWQYYSINGNNVYLSGEFKGGRPFNDVGVGRWDSPIDFFNSEYNVTQGEAGKQNRNINNYGFSEGYHIKTTPEQDEIMRNSFIQISKTEYKLLGNNCATAVQKVMFDANIPVAESKYETIYVPANRKLGESGYKIVKPNFDVYPSSAFESIINANPNGEYIKHNNNKDGIR